MSGDYITLGGVLHKMGFERVNWRKRYFVLTKNEVKYYSDDKDAKNLKNEKGGFYLDYLTKGKIKAVETGTILVNSNALSAKNTKVTLNKKFLIQIGDCRWKDHELRTFYVSCESSDERDEWIRALNQNLEIYLNTQEGQEDMKKPLADGPRKEAHNVWAEEQKKIEEKAKADADAKARQEKTKAMREEPWYRVHTLCSKGTLEELKQAVEQGVQVNLKNPNGGSTLLQAATYGNIDIMRYLIEQQGLDINGASNGGNTALHAAACMGFYEAAKLLLEKGADRTLINREGKTAGQSAKNDRIRELIEGWGGTPVEAATYP